MQYQKYHICESFLISLEKVHTNFQRNPSTAQIPAPKQILPSQKPGVGPAYLKEPWLGRCKPQIGPKRDFCKILPKGGSRGVPLSRPMTLRCRKWTIQSRSFSKHQKILKTVEFAKSYDHLKLATKSKNPQIAMWRLRFRTPVVGDWTQNCMKLSFTVKKLSSFSTYQIWDPGTHFWCTATKYNFLRSEIMIFYFFTFFCDFGAFLAPVCTF